MVIWTRAADPCRRIIRIRRLEAMIVEKWRAADLRRAGVGRRGEEKKVTAVQFCYSYMVTN